MSALNLGREAQKPVIQSIRIISVNLPRNVPASAARLSLHDAFLIPARPFLLGDLDPRFARNIPLGQAHTILWLNGVLVKCLQAHGVTSTESPHNISVFLIPAANHAERLTDRLILDAFKAARRDGIPELVRQIMLERLELHLYARIEIKWLIKEIIDMQPRAAGNDVGRHRHTAYLIRRLAEARDQQRLQLLIAHCVEIENQGIHTLSIIKLVHAPAISQPAT